MPGQSRPSSAVSAAIAVLAAFAFAAMVNCQAANVLLVTDGTSPNAEESSRKSAFEGWGHTVTTIQDSSSQSAFDTAMASVDMVYVPCTVTDWELFYKLRTATVGVINERTGLEEEFGFADGDGYSQPWDTVEEVDNTHEVTSGLATGYVTMTSSTQSLTVNSSTVSAGVQVLATMNYGGLSVGVIEAGGTLANTYIGNSEASGRRVRLPWGNGTWGVLNSSGLLLTQNALNWASGTTSDSLLLHWKLDESSGSTAVDSSIFGRDGALGGTTSWIAAKRDNGLRLSSGGQVSVASELGEPSSFTIAGWANTSASDTDGAAVLSVGDCVALLSHNASSGGPAISYWNGATQETVTASGGSRVGTGWHHYAATFDNATKATKIYVDGELVGSATKSGSPLYNVGTQTIAGDESTGYYAMHHTGSLDDLRVYSSVLSQSEIVDLYGLIGHWRFDESSGSTIADSSPNANDAAFNTGTPTWVSGVRTAGLQFDGSNDADTDAPFDPPATGTLAFWYRLNAAPTSAQRLLGSGDNWEVRAESDGALYADLGGSAGTVFKTPTGSAAAGQWHHLVAIYSDEDDEFELYLDGQLVASGTNTIDDQTASTLSFGIRTGSTEHFDGALDDVRVYSYKLSAADVAELYGLIGHWKLDEASGTTAADSSLKSADGTHTGGVTVNAAGPYPGEGDTAAEFDGGDDHVALPSVSSNFDDGVTISVWARPTDNKIWARFFETGNGEWIDNILLARDSVSNNLALHIHDGSSGSGYITATDAIINDEWHHYVAVVDSSGFARLYRDAELLQTATTGVPNNNERSKTYIGRSNYGADGYYQGRMHDVRLYNRPLSHSEVAEIYGLVAHWKLDESSGSTAYDSSGMGNDASLSGTQDWTNGSVDGGSGHDYSDGDDYFEAPASDVLNNVNEGSYSVTAWYKPLSVPPGTGSDNNAFHGILIKEGYHLGLYYNYNQQFEFVNYLDGYTWSGAESYANTYATGTFHHVAGVVNLSDGVLDIYVNGQLKDSVSFTPGAIGQDYGTNPWRIGIGGPGFAEWRWPAHGVIDDVRIYNRPLGADEVDAIYSSGQVQGIRIIKWVEAR